MKNLGTAIKGIAVGLTVGALATMVLSNNKSAKKLKKTAENTADNITSMFKLN